jgi:hypothetical protein
MEAILFSVVHVNLVDLVVGLERCFVGWDAFVDGRGSECTRIRCQDLSIRDG